MSLWLSLQILYDSLNPSFLFFRQGITNLKLVALTSTNKKVLENLFHIVFPYYVLEIALIQK